VGLWILAGVVATLMLVVVLVALAAERTEERPPRPAPPRWHLPTPEELAAPGFPLAVHGYDPDHVDAWVEGVRRAQAELLAALGPDAVAELRGRLAGDPRSAPTDDAPLHDAPTGELPTDTSAADAGTDVPGGASARHVGGGSDAGDTARPSAEPGAGG
jgi:hypothetical protein